MLDAAGEDLGELEQVDDLDREAGGFEVGAEAGPVAGGPVPLGVRRGVRDAEPLAGWVLRRVDGLGQGGGCGRERGGDKGGSMDGARRRVGHRAGPELGLAGDNL